MKVLLSNQNMHWMGTFF